MPAFIVIGLGYGDEGKGAVTDHLARTHHASGVVLTNGGAQRAHHVVLPDGRFHRFSQFGSGFFAGVPSYLDRHFLVNPHEIFQEGSHLTELGFSPWQKMQDVPSLSVHADSLVTTPFHIAMNRLREYMRGQNRHGSCGMGIGETVADSQKGTEIRVRDLRDRKLLYEKLHDLQIAKRKEALSLIYELPGAFAHHLAHPFFDFEPIDTAMEVYRIFNKIVPVFEEFYFPPEETWIFESGQGVLLDEYNGFHPHTTWSVSTGQNALDDLAEHAGGGYSGETTKVGVMRSYMTRHGAGPFVTEDPALAERFPEAHNGHGAWQGSWRVGWTDLRAIHYALSCVGDRDDDLLVDELAVTHMDRVKGDWKVCLNYTEPIGAPAVNQPREKWLMDRSWNLNQLAEAKPLYVEFGNIQPDDLLEVIEAETGVPIGTVSYGPTDYRQVVMA